MLTDCHVHLRPDEPGTTAGELFTAANAERYRPVAEERGIVELGVSEHVHRFRQALDVWTHPFWRQSAEDDVDEYCAWVREETDLRLGIELDFLPGREDRTATLPRRGSGTTSSARATTRHSSCSTSSGCASSASSRAASGARS